MLYCFSLLVGSSDFRSSSNYNCRGHKRLKLMNVELRIPSTVWRREFYSTHMIVFIWLQGVASYVFHDEYYVAALLQYVLMLRPLYRLECRSTRRVSGSWLACTGPWHDKTNWVLSTRCSEHVGVRHYCQKSGNRVQRLGRQLEHDVERSVRLLRIQ